MKQYLARGLSFATTIGIPLLYVYILLIILATRGRFNPDFITLIFGVFFPCCGLALWITCMISLGNSFGVLPQKQRRIKTGLYKYHNHPMYVGIMVSFVGISLSLGSLAGIIITLVILLPMLLIRAYFEGKSLLS